MNAGPMKSDDRFNAYIRQGSRQSLTARQERQLDRMSARGWNRLDSEIKAATNQPESVKGTMLPQLGASDDHSQTLLKMGYALGNMGKHIYAGTVPRATVAHRRATNKRARAARRVGRR